VFTLEEVRRTFDNWAPRYNATHASRLLKRRQARLALDIRPGDRLIEVACGTGLNFAHLRDVVGDAGRVVGVDVAPAMLEIARREIARHGWRNVEALEADAARLPFQDGSFDKALCAFALNIIPDYERAIAEVRRVLAPRGRFVALELSLNASSVPHWLLPLAERFMGICAVDLSHRTLDALRRAFQTVDVRRYLGGAIFIAVADKNGLPS
jgi:ubiquinone/menaquinone biosynthesis C-methylase UbiE